MPTVNMSIRLDEAVIKDLAAQAKREGRSASNLAAVLIRIALPPRIRDKSIPKVGA